VLLILYITYEHKVIKVSGVRVFVGCIVNEDGLKKNNPKHSRASRVVLNQ